MSNQQTIENQKVMARYRFYGMPKGERYAFMAAGGHLIDETPPRPQDLPKNVMTRVDFDGLNPREKMDFVLADGHVIDG